MDVTKLSRQQFEKALVDHGLRVSECFIEKGATWVAYCGGLEYFPYENADGSITIECHLVFRRRGLDKS